SPVGLRGMSGRRSQASKRLAGPLRRPFRPFLDSNGLPTRFILWPRSPVMTVRSAGTPCWLRLSVGERRVEVLTLVVGGDAVQDAEEATKLALLEHLLQHRLPAPDHELYPVLLVEVDQAEGRRAQVAVGPVAPDGLGAVGDDMPSRTLRMARANSLR